MPEPDNDPTVPDPLGHFLLEIPLSKADAAARTLRDAGIHFNPEQAITGQNQHVGLWVNHTGHNLQDAIDHVNHHQQEMKRRHRVVPATGMTLQERHAILTFTVRYCDWADDVAPYVTDIDPAGWHELEREHPNLIVRPD